MIHVSSGYLEKCMAVLSEQQRKFYQTTIQLTKEEISELQEQIEAERAKFNDRVAELENAIKAARQIYSAACARLGIANDMPD
jgi:Cu2+-containing amine oxidase